MGFGLIFLGFVTLLFFKIVPIGLLGSYLMFKGLSMLCPYGKNFRRARLWSVILGIYFAFYTCLWTLNAIGLFNFTQVPVLLYTDEILYYIVLTIFCFYLYSALGDISAQVGFEKGVKRENLCKAFLYVFAIVTIMRFILVFLNLNAYVSAPIMFFELLWLICSCVYIYSCYMMIATQEIIDDENKKMRQYDKKYSMLKKKKTDANKK